MTEQRGRKALAPAANEYSGPAFAPATPAPVARIEAAMRQDVAAAEDRAQALATQLGYEGAVTIGALEDEIRFYQRRTVEACLELGKRLMVLKELTPHGEFEQRVEMLGFSKRSAQRFMQASAKTAKSANLALLATQVKSASAFLELVTHDDDVLEDVAQMDDVDRMSASELRATVREAERRIAQAKDEARQALEAKDKLVERKNRERDQAVEELEAIKAGSRDKKKALALERETVATTKLADAALSMLGYVGRFDQALADLLALGTPAASAQAEQTTAYVFQRIAAIACERGMLVDFQEVVSPSWLPQADGGAA